MFDAPSNPFHDFSQKSYVRVTEHITRTKNFRRRPIYFSPATKLRSALQGAALIIFPDFSDKRATLACPSCLANSFKEFETADKWATQRASQGSDKPCTALDNVCFSLLLSDTRTQSTQTSGTSMLIQGFYEMYFNESMIFTRSPWILGKVILQSCDWRQKILLIPTKQDKRNNDRRRGCWFWDGSANKRGRSLKQVNTSGSIHLCI